MKKLVIFLLFLSCSAAQQKSKLYEDSDIRIYCYDNKDYQMVIDTLLCSVKKIKETFNISLKHKTEVYIYRNQKEFWKNTFPRKKNNGASTGFANLDNFKLSLTSPYDTSVKSFDKMIKVPAHEVIHFLLPHGIIPVREGIAVYFANQITPVDKKDIPKKESDLIFYSKDKLKTAKAYNISGWQIKFIFEECLKKSPKKFLEYLEVIKRGSGYKFLGFKNEKEFFISFGSYLRNLQ